MQNTFINGGLTVGLSHYLTLWNAARLCGCQIDDGVEGRSQTYSIIGSDCHCHFSAVQIRFLASEADLLYCCLFDIAIKW